MGPETGEVVIGIAATLVETAELESVSFNGGERCQRVVVPGSARSNCLGEDWLGHSARAIRDSQGGSLQ